jgi:hypothetical protein
MTPAPPALSGRQRALRSGLAAALWAPAILLLALVVEVWKDGLASPFQVDYGEAQILHSALAFLRGQPIYPPIGGYPYLSTAYPPIYISLCAIGVRLTGPGFVVGRLISLSAGIAAAILAGAIVWRETRWRGAAALTAALLPGVGFITWWTLLMRVDALALALSMLGLLLALRSRHAIAALVFAAALYTRQSAIAAPAAVFCALLLERRGREAARFAAALAAALVVPLVALTAATGGLFYVHVFKFLALHAWRWSNLTPWFERILVPWPVLVGLGVATAIWALRRRRHAAPAFYFIFSALVSLTAGKIGSSPGYFIEALAAACVLVGVAYGSSQRAWLERGRTRLGVALAIIVVAQAAGMVAGFGGVMQRVIQPIDPAASRAALQRIRETKGDILCEDYGLLDLAGRRVLLEPFEFTQMVRARLVDPGPVLDDLRRGRFALIIIRTNPADLPPLGAARDSYGGVWYGPMLDEMRAHYAVREMLYPYYLLAPLRLTPSSPRAPGRG